MISWTLAEVDLSEIHVPEIAIAVTVAYCVLLIIVFFYMNLVVFSCVYLLVYGTQWACFERRTSL